MHMTITYKRLSYYHRGSDMALSRLSAMIFDRWCYTSYGYPRCKCMVRCSYAGSCIWLAPLGFILAKCTSADAVSIGRSVPDRIDVSRAAFTQY